LSIIFMIWVNKKIGPVKLLIKNNWGFYIVSIALLFLTSGFVIVGLRGGFRHSTRPIAISNAGEFTQQPNEINLVINTPFSIIKTIRTEPLKKVDYFNNSLALNKIYNPIHNPNGFTQSFRNKNIVFIILESFNKEYLGSFNKNLDGGKYKGYTPFLDSLKSVSLSFNNAYANGRKSIEALPSILASIPGIKEPFILSYYSTNKIHGIGELLSKKGYQTSFFHGAPNGSMGFTSFVKMAGVAHYYGMTEYNNNADFDGIWGIWDEPFLQYWAKEMNTFKEPFFSTVFTVSSHHPFELPDKYKGKFPKGTLPVHQNIGYTDRSLRAFFATAKKSEWYKNTIFVITADHSSVSTHPGYKTSLGAFAIPIIIFDPTGELKGAYDYPVQQIDIMPTILNYLRYNKPYFAFGHDMLNRDSSAFVAQYIDEQYQIIMGDEVLKFNEHQAPELYNYRDDILLKYDISKSKPSDRERLETYLKAFIQQYNQHLIDNYLGIK
jgi:phosphoglycerol transferase MdoB-like AlkP superfamily enzyme